MLTTYIGLGGGGLSGVLGPQGGVRGVILLWARRPGRGRRDLRSIALLPEHGGCDD